MLLDSVIFDFVKEKKLIFANHCYFCHPFPPSPTSVLWMYIRKLYQKYPEKYCLFYIIDKCHSFLFPPIQELMVNLNGIESFTICLHNPKNYGLEINVDCFPLILHFTPSYLQH